LITEADRTPCCTASLNDYLGLLSMDEKNDMQPAAITCTHLEMCTWGAD